jgi:hypothetical protein
MHWGFSFLREEQHNLRQELHDFRKEMAAFPQYRLPAG